MTVAIDVDLDDDFMRLAVRHIVGLESETVLAAQHGIDRTQNVRQFAFESYRIECAATLFRERLHGVIGLQERHPVDWNSADVGASAGIHVVTELLDEHLSGAHDVNRNSRILNNLARLIHVDLAEGVEA